MNAATVDKCKEQSGVQASSAWIMSVLTLALSGVFILAGVNKLRDLAGFEVSLIHWRIFPDEWIAPLTWGVPFVEILAGWVCLPPRSRQAGFRFLLFLTGIYTLLLVIEWARGIAPDCGCFGASSAHWPYYALALRNVGLMMLEVLLIDFNSTRQLQPSDGAPISGGLR